MLIRKNALSFISMTQAILFLLFSSTAQPTEFSMPAVEDQFKELEEKLDLTEEWLKRIEPILRRSN